MLVFAKFVMKSIGIEVSKFSNPKVLNSSIFTRRLSENIVSSDGRNIIAIFLLSSTPPRSGVHISRLREPLDRVAVLPLSLLTTLYNRATTPVVDISVNEMKDDVMPVTITNFSYSTDRCVTLKIA